MIKIRINLWFGSRSAFFESLDPDPQFDPDAKFFFDFYYLKKMKM
jgi:hypothetical protein